MSHSSPRRDAVQSLKKSTHHLFKGIGKLIASISPVPDLLEPQNTHVTQLRWIKILMGDGVSPDIQLFKPSLTPLITGIQVFHFVPKRKPKSIVILSNVSGISIP